MKFCNLMFIVFLFYFIRLSQLQEIDVFRASVLIGLENGSTQASAHCCKVAALDDREGKTKMHHL